MATSSLGILLAAGTGSRFGPGNKLLAELDAEPIVVHAARTLVDAAEDGVLDDVVVVVGNDATRIRVALSDLPVETVANPDYESGQGTSVATGARVARDRDADAAVFALADMPRIAPATVARLLDSFADTDHDIVVPVTDGQRGNPAVFGAALFSELTELAGDTGGRELFDVHPFSRVQVTDEGIHQDVDTPEDLAELRETD